MYNPRNVDEILKFGPKDLGLLPTSEDDFHEYKVCLTKDSDLADKIARAASAFWNSGGGLFVAGVNSNGKPDGGVNLTVGRQSRRDWVDQVISRVTPQGRYVVHCVEDCGTGANINLGNAVLLIGFAPSEVGPHMAPDKRYYIRAGAHTCQANHFIVESIWSRRHFAKPRIIHVLDNEPWTTASDFLILELVSVTGAPALSLEIEITPHPTDRTLLFPLKTTLIDGSHSFAFRFEIPRSGFEGILSVVYQDQGGTQYKYEAPINSATCLPKWHRNQTQIDGIKEVLVEINRSLQRRN